MLAARESPVAASKAAGSLEATQHLVRRVLGRLLPHDCLSRRSEQASPRPVQRDAIEPALEIAIARGGMAYSLLERVMEAIQRAVRSRVAATRARYSCGNARL